MRIKVLYNNKLSWSVISLFLLTQILLEQELRAQEPPPRPVEVTVTAQTLNFGAFSHGSSGGTVTVTPAPVRSATGDVVLLNLGYSFSPALFLLVADPGTVISITKGPNINLTRGGGGTLGLAIGETDPSGSFVINTTPPAYTEFKVGGVLTVSNSTNNPPGSYSGSFDITFNQE